MAWSLPQYNRGRVDAAGKTLVSSSHPADDALAVINNWRASHSLPLYMLRKRLESRAKRIDASAVVAQRIKRINSIASKLASEPHMKLSQMQDVGGCRAIMPSVADALALDDAYTKSDDRNRGPEFFKKFDYILHPKQDGYRGIHLVYKYRTGSRLYAACNGHRIEIQIRSQLQHAWATAFEIASMFGSLPLRPQGFDRSAGLNPPTTKLLAWKRFFALMGSAIAIREGQPVVPGTPQDQAESTRELRESAENLNARFLLANWTLDILDLPESERSSAYYFLIEVNPKTRGGSIHSFTKEESQEAFTAYTVAERMSQHPSQVVLVSVDKVDALRAAYPNYWADSLEFMSALNQALA